jgi:hypothetical protein
MRPVGEASTAEDYRAFGEREAQDSPCYSAWALGVADDPEVLALLEDLPPAKRQPNLVLAAARRHGAAPGPYDGLRRVLVEDWPAVRATVLARATQTNEAARCATLLPVLARLPGPLALIEVGCSAGLCLLPDRYSYRYETGAGIVEVHPATGPSPVVLDCVVEGDVPVPRRVPEVVWRAGVDLDPVDVADPDATAWLETLVWPEQDDRRARLAAALALARADPPPLVRGDLLEELPGLAAAAPRDATLVVLHTAVAAYLSAADRRRLVGLVGSLPGHWLSNEGPQVLPLPVPPPPHEGSAVGAAPFLMALDGRPVAWTHGHGRALAWVG